MRQFPSRTCVYLFVSSLFLFSLTAARGDLKPTSVASQYTVALNSEAGWDLNVELNHPDGLYKVGDKLELRFSSPSKPAHVNLFNIGPDGKVCLIWPNEYHTENKVNQAETVQFPTPGSKVTLRARAPVGKELLVLLATERPLNLRDPDEARKLAEFLENVKSRDKSPLTQLRSFVAEQEKTYGWSGKAIEITTQANAETPLEPKVQDYRPANGCFSVQGIGEFQQKEIKSGIISHICRCGTTEFSVSHFTVPELSPGEAATVMDHARKNQKKELNGTVLAEQSIEVPGGFGFELLIQHRLENLEYTTLTRTLRFGNRVYVVTVSDFGNTFRKATADTFMKSFKFVSPDKQVSGT